MVRPSRRKDMAIKAVKERGICIRVACQAFRIIVFGDSGYVVCYRVDPRFVTVLEVRHQKDVGF